MRKIFLTLTVFFMGILLVACTDQYDIQFRDSEQVEMSYEEISTMINDINWEEGMLSSLLTINADFDITQSTSMDDMSSSMDINLLFDSKTYVVDSETITDVALHSESNLDVAIDQSYEFGTISGSTTMGIEGSVGAYVTDGYFYLNPDISVDQEGSNTSISFKEKLNQQLTEADLSDILGDDIINPDDYNDILNEELLAIMEITDFEAILASFPAVTVYQRDQITGIHFEITKTLINDHLEDLAWAVYDELVAAGEDVGTEAEFTLEVSEMMSDVTEALAYIDDFSFTLDIIVDNGELARIAFGFSLSMDHTEDGEHIVIDGSMSIVMDFGVEIPAFPNDLDDYTGVNDFGDSFNGLLTPMAFS